jgi:phosphatidylglycerophosphatase A
VKLNFFEKLLGTGFFTGYIPFASGTFASMAALLVYFIPGFENPLILIPAVILFTFYGIYVGGKFETLFGKDPSECTIDEVAGMWISLLWVPKNNILFPILAFFIWRIMDIIKPYPARKLENLKGGLGIMIDDLVASIYSLAIIQIFLFIFYR